MLTGGRRGEGEKWAGGTYRGRDRAELCPKGWLQFGRIASLPPKKQKWKSECIFLAGEEISYYLFPRSNLVYPPFFAALKAMWS